MLNVILGVRLNRVDFSVFNTGSWAFRMLCCSTLDSIRGSLTLFPKRTQGGFALVWNLWLSMRVSTSWPCVRDSPNVHWHAFAIQRIHGHLGGILFGQFFVRPAFFLVAKNSGLATNANTASKCTIWVAAMRINRCSKAVGLAKRWSRVRELIS